MACGRRAGARCHQNRKEQVMRLPALTFGAGLLLAAATAFAFHCPADMKKIDAALAKNPSLSAQQLSEVKKLRAEGEALHNAGKHQESLDTLAKAMQILGI
jgi:hypothetical protein